jgi:hypothetical protein
MFDPAVDVSEFRQRRAGQGEDQRDAARAVAVYDVPVEIAGETFAVGAHLECRVLVPDQAVLETQVFFLPAIHTDPATLVGELMAGLAVPDATSNADSGDAVSSVDTGARYRDTLTGAGPMDVTASASRP